MSPVPRYKPFAGPAVFTQGFRPFFLFAAVHAALAVPVWLALRAGLFDLPTLWTPQHLHAHEMLFGYLGAVVAGFLLTAVPNWTGRLPLQGFPLIGLVALWVAARSAAPFSGLLGPIAWAAVALAFPLALLAAIAREIVAGRNWRNLKVLVILALLLAADLGYHVEIALRGQPLYAQRVASAAMVMLVGLIGGRIVPSFTLNRLRPRGGRLPVPFDRLDSAAMIAGAAALVAWTLRPDATAAALLAMVAGILHLVRLARWAGDRTVREPILLVLHLAYAFIPLGFLLVAAEALTAAVGPAAAVHAWGVGAFGLMPLAVMTRASLGHTGRALSADVVTVTGYAAMFAAGLLRIGAATAMPWAEPLLLSSAAAWCAAFAAFLIGFGPILTQPAFRRPA